MTDETKKLFNAPWKVDEMFPKFVDDKDGFFLAETESERVTARLARLPELYDELERMVNVECVNACERHGPCDKPCDVVKPAIELLKKVRNGE